MTQKSSQNQLFIVLFIVLIPRFLKAAQLQRCACNCQPPELKDTKWQSRDQPDLIIVTATLWAIRINWHGLLHCRRVLRKDVCQTVHRQSPGRSPFWPTCTAQTTAAVYLSTETMKTCQQMTPDTTIIHCTQQLQYTALPTHYTLHTTQRRIHTCNT